MKRLIANIAVLAGLIIILVNYYPASYDESQYWYFLTNHMVLNFALAISAITIGFLVKNYAYTLVGSSLVLVIYCLTFIFQNSSFDIKQYFLAIYTVFLAFSVLANLCRHFKDWLLTIEDSCLSEDALQSKSL